MNLEPVGEISPSRLSRSRRSSSSSQGQEEEGFDFLNLNKRDEGTRDCLWLGDSDSGVRKLCEELGWWEELEGLYEREREVLDLEMKIEEEERSRKLKSVRNEGPDVEEKEEDLDSLTVGLGKVVLEEGVVVVSVEGEKEPVTDQPSKSVL